ncbi:right-handed parallel beta-helix repeat-containing protein [Haloferax namakaokahaiae]|uniref:Right-handed parallel beta-helix repeat-containing protein n=1 Tax=Haloferax namakaokahaiae TaxID=1748331 RepID=A0ABD5ZK96_9EURY
MNEIELYGKTTITEPGTYTLGQDIPYGGGTHLSEACFSIEANDVVFDGGGLTIGGNGVSDTSAIVATDVQNVVIKNVTLARWDYGIRFENVVGGQIRDAEVTGNGYGLVFHDSYLCIIRDSHVSENLLGVVFDSFSDVALLDTTVESNSGRDTFRIPTELL